LSIQTGGEVKTDADIVEEEPSYPVLIPGLDLFNRKSPLIYISPTLDTIALLRYISTFHKLISDSRGTPITWLSSPITSSAGSTPSVSFLNSQPVPAGKEVYNNYGPKSNEELLLSYGFVLSPNPDDTLILRLGASEDIASRLKSEGIDVKQRFAVRKDGEIPQELLRTMRAMMGGNVHEHGEGCGHNHADDEDDEDEDGHEAHAKEMEEMELEMDVLGTLGGMLEDKLGKLRVEVQVGEGVRKDVKRMCELYRQGE
jgi:hypothetical protein